MKSDDCQANRVTGLWKRPGLAVAIFAIEFCCAAARGQGTVAPSSFHPFTTPDSTVSPFGRNSGYQTPAASFQTSAVPFRDQTPDQGAASAFGTNSAFSSSGGPPVPITKDTGFAAKHFRIGPVTFTAGAGLGLQFNDNILQSSSDRKADLILDPSIYVLGTWRLSSINTLSLRLGAGYDYYLFHPNLGTGLSFQIVPGTELSFKAKLGDVSLVLFDRPSLQQSPQGDPTAPSGVLYSEFDNSAGISALWNPRHDLTVQATYNHSDTIPLKSTVETGSTTNNFDTQSLRRTVDSLSSSVTFQFRDDVSAGIEGAASSIRYPSGRNNGVSLNVGVFGDKQLSKYTALRITAGYQKFSFKSAASPSLGAGNDNSSSSGFYGSILLNNRLNRYTRLSLSVGREGDVSAISNSVVTTYARAEATLKLSRGIAINVHGGYEYCQPSDSSLGNFSQIVFGLGTSYAINSRLGISIAYDLVSRVGGNGQGSNPLNNQLIGNNDYYQNRVTLNVSYAF